MQGLAVGTGTAALILGLHPEYVRQIIRRGRLVATKENGEFQVGLPALVDFMEREMKSLSGPAHQHKGFAEIPKLESTFHSFIWRHPPDEGPEAEGKRA